MKKVFLTISRGSIARNLLQNSFYESLYSKCQVIILTPAAEDEAFKKEFARPNVSFIPMHEIDHNRWDRLLFFFHKNLVYNPTVAQKNRWGTIGTDLNDQPSYISFVIKKIIFTPLSKIRPLRDVVRWLDFVFLQKDEVSHFTKLIEEHRPHLVIVTNISADTEAALMKAAKRKKIKVVGMAKSWDNLSKHGFRVKADTLVVWNQFMKDQSLLFQNYKNDQIAVIGIPQFDYYTDTSRIWTREKFCQLYNLDANKKIILFGSEGKKFPTDADIASIIHEDIQKNLFTVPSQLLVRPHYGYKKDEQKFKKLFNTKDVVVDMFNHPSPYFRDEWDYSKEFMDRFLNTLYHADVTINTCSTLSLDAVVFDKPIVNIAFDGYKILPYEESICRWYETHYYRAIVHTGAVTIVNNREELRSAVNNYLKNPVEKEEGRMKLKAYFCDPYDGKAGERFAQVVFQLLNI